MKTLLLTFLFSCLSATVHADGQFRCVMNVSGGFNWENGSWELTNFTKTNILISIQGGGTRLKYKDPSDNYETDFTCTTFFIKENHLCALGTT